MKSILPAILLILVSAALLFAQPPSAGCPKDKKAGKERHWRKEGPSMKALKEKLGLSDDQIKKLETLRIGTRKSMETTRHAIEMEKLSFRELTLNGTVSKVKMRESLKKIDDLMQKAHAARIQAAQAALEVFTEEQFKKMAENKMLGEFLMPGDMPEGPDSPDEPPMKGRKPDHD